MDRQTSIRPGAFALALLKLHERQLENCAKLEGQLWTLVGKVPPQLCTA